MIGRLALRAGLILSALVLATLPVPAHRPPGRSASARRLHFFEHSTASHATLLLEGQREARAMDRPGHPLGHVLAGGNPPGGRAGLAAALEAAGDEEAHLAYSR